MVKVDGEQGTDGGSVGTRVRAARTAAGLTLEQVSTQIGVSPATLSLIERDKVSVTVERLTNIARVFGIEFDELMSGEGAPDGGAAEAGGRTEETLPKVLEAAVDCFTKWGYHGTSMRQIAQAGDVSVAGVYHYYESKHQMLVAILDTTMERLITSLEAARERVADQPPDQRFFALVERLAYHHAATQKMAFLGASEMRSLEEPHRSRIAGLRNSVQYMIDEEALAAAEEGLFTAPDIKFSCRLISTMCTSLAQWYDPQGPVTPEDAAQTMAHSARAMLRIEPCED